jgi:pimeloyl-ACP methyl ester carboxylesterase
MYRTRTDTLTFDRGTGPTIVFSHRTMMDRSMFLPQIEALSDDYRTVAYDSRARTDRWAGPYDLGDLVEDCRALIDTVADDRVVLAGMSMGGFIALRFAIEYPEYLDGLVLIDTMAVPHTSEEQAEYGTMFERIRDEATVPDEITETVADLVFGETTHEERPAIVDRWRRRWKTYPGGAVYHEVSSWLTRPSVEEELADVDVPVLIVHGAEDVVLDISRAEPMAEQFPDAVLVRIPEAGHTSNVERPSPVNRAIREHLRSIYG